MGIERRRHPRYEILAQVRVAHGETTHVLEVGNISISGAYVLWSDEGDASWIEHGRHVVMALFVPEHVENLPLGGTIVHAALEAGGITRGFGVQFDDDLAPSARRELERLIALAASADRPPPLRRRG